MFQIVAKLCSENEVKIWIMGHDLKMKTSRVVILVFQMVAELCSGYQLLKPAQPLGPVSAIFETLLSCRDCYRLVTSVLAAADVFSVFTAKNIHRMSKNIDRMRPKTS